MAIFAIICSREPFLGEIEMHKPLALTMQAQPTEVTCGPTCLDAVYRYYGEKSDLAAVVNEIPMLEGGGTLAVVLGCHALKKGYKTTIYTYNLNVFDPTWFTPHPLSQDEVADKLRQQAHFKNSKKLNIATESYLEYLKLGGKITFKDLDQNLLRHYLKQGIPILTGLSSTFLYRNPRETPLDEDDVRGDPEGHFVVLSGYNLITREITVSDPFLSNPYSHTLSYKVKVDRVICAILLGVLTFDANFLIIHPPGKKKEG